MSQLDEAVIRYNKLLENGVYRDLGWAEELHAANGGGRAFGWRPPDLPVPAASFISRRQYDSLVKPAKR